MPPRRISPGVYQQGNSTVRPAGGVMPQRPMPRPQVGVQPMMRPQAPGFGGGVPPTMPQQQIPQYNQLPQMPPQQNPMMDQMPQGQSPLTNPTLQQLPTGAPGQLQNQAALQSAFGQLNPQGGAQFNQQPQVNVGPNKYGAV